MLYLTVKVIHIVAVVVWIGALFLLTVISSTNTMTAAQIKTARRVTEAGIGLTWLAGITLAVLGSWYPMDIAGASLRQQATASSCRARIISP